MNLLELVKALAAEASTVSPSEITTVTDYASDPVPNEHVADLIRWIRQSDREIQVERDDWLFRLKEGKIDMFPGDGDYDVTNFISDYWRVSPYSQGHRYIRVGTDYMPVEYVTYPQWRGDFDRRRLKASQGRPTHFTVAPDNTLKVYPIPSTESELFFDYVRKPCLMTITDECEPVVPQAFRMLIVYRALMKHAMHDESQFQAQRAQVEYNRMMMSMRNDQLPETRFKVG